MRYSYTSGMSLCLLFLTACSGSNTKLSQTWSDPDFSTSYNDIMIVGITQSEQLRRAYETYFADQVHDRGMESLPSYKLINHKYSQDITQDKNSFRNIVAAAIKGSDIDAVLITHVVSIEDEEVYQPSPGIRPAYYTNAYYGNMYGYHGYVTSYVSQPGYFKNKLTYVLETSMYDVKTEELVWTTRSRTFAPESMDVAIKELTGQIIDDLVSRKIIR